jgi:hypothetical protein
MAYDLMLRQNTARNFAREVDTKSIQPYKEGLLGIATIAGLLALAAFKRQHEIKEARVQYVDPAADITTRLVRNPSIREIMYRHRVT